MAKRSKISAGLMLFRRQPRLQVLLAHPGGPFFAKKDKGAWSIPKGEIEEEDDPLKTACREFKEELGVRMEGPFIELGSVKQKGGKMVHAWAVEGDYDDSGPPPSNTFTMEWPPRSGKQQEFPEIDKATFFDVETAREKINPAQAELIERLAERVDEERRI